jgi:membrane-bound lytic murein transglycosylase A
MQRLPIIDLALPLAARYARIVVCIGLAASVGCRSPAEAKDAPRSDAPVAVLGDAGVGSAAAAGACICGPDDPDLAPPVHDQLTLTKAAYTDLPGWADDKHAEAVPSFLRSCEKLAKLKDDEPVGHDGHGGLAKQWRKACAAAKAVTAGDNAAAKKMFEAEFVPYVAAGKAGPEGKLTGYYVQEMRGSRKKSGKYQTPVYARPKDLVMVDLSLYLKDAHGRRIWGKLDAKNELVPAATREEIRKGALDGKGLELIYVDEPIDLLFAQIEGSAKAKLDDGSVVWLEFAGKNGRSYLGVGGVLKGMGELKTPGSGTMQGIRKWFEDHRPRWNEVVDKVHSYVFFHESALAGAVGSQMTILTTRRSMAVDRAFIAASTPIWVETRAPVVGLKTNAPWHSLLIAQDTGAGIQGAVRGDIYWGDDAAAAEIGGRMGGPGRYWLLLPKGVTK